MELTAEEIQILDAHQASYVPGLPLRPPVRGWVRLTQQGVFHEFVEDRTLCEMHLGSDRINRDTTFASSLTIQEQLDAKICKRCIKKASHA